MKRFNIIITLSATLGLFSCELDKMPMDQKSVGRCILAKAGRL